MATAATTAAAGGDAAAIVTESRTRLRRAQRRAHVLALRAQLHDALGRAEATAEQRNQANQLLNAAILEAHRPHRAACQQTMVEGH
eukprot:514483-Lingulodinium_polyedra.AAC.1